MTIWEGDCLELFERIPTGTVDMVLADVPYGQTRNAWDTPILFTPMWAALRRVAKPDAAIVLMAAQPFASRLVCSNIDEFRYDLIWSKNKATGFLNAKKQPLRSHEHILVFYRKLPFFEPQMTKGHRPGNYARQAGVGSNYGTTKENIEYGGSEERYPTSVLSLPIINNDDPDKVHPTQKPVELMAWLIRTFTRPGEMVLDFTAGSGSTAVAAIREGRRHLLIEKNSEYVRIAERRVLAEFGIN